MEIMFAGKLEASALVTSAEEVKAALLNAITNQIPCQLYKIELHVSEVSTSNALNSIA